MIKIEKKLQLKEKKIPIYTLHFPFTDLCFQVPPLWHGGFTDHCLKKTILLHYWKSKTIIDNDKVELTMVSSNMTNNEVRGSQRLQTLLHHLQSSSNSISITNPLEQVSNSKPNNKRAAVLICLFEGQDGNLRVILTQRASSLSTHAG
jgi:hypothetical protein